MKSSGISNKVIGFLFVAALVSLAPDSAWAVETGCKSEDGTVGKVICNVLDSSALVPGLLAGISYLFGLVLGVMGIIKLYEHVQEPRQTPPWEFMKKFLAAGSFLALPVIMSAARTTLVGSKEVGAVQISQFNLAEKTSGGLDSMVVALVGNIWSPMSALLGAFGYLAGIVLIMVGISRLLKTAQEGPRGPGGIGTIMTFITGGALFSLSQMMGAWVSSLFSDGTAVSNFANMSFTGGLNDAALGHVHNVISAVLGFMIIIGWISFIRGWFILREVAEGNHQASMMAAMTHLFGGALAINLGGVINAVETTFGLDGYGIAFTTGGG